MENFIIFGIVVKVYRFVFKYFIKTGLIYPSLLLYTMSVLLNKGIFIDYWHTKSPVYWGFYLLLILSMIPFIKKVFNIIRGIYIKIKSLFIR